MTNYKNIPSLREHVRVKKDKNTEELEKAAEEWTRAAAKNHITYELDWLGIPVIQTPEDLVLMQELLFKIQPDILIETGVAHGGSLIYYASLFELLGKGHVVGVDIEIREHNRKALEVHPLFKRISLIEGSSIDAETIRQVEEKIPKDATVVVCLDSNHTKGHVLEELKAYQKFVTPDSYLVVFDTNTSRLAELGAADKMYLENGPMEALDEFLKENKEFEIDKKYNKLYTSYSPNGYLRRVL